MARRAYYSQEDEESQHRRDDIPWSHTPQPAIPERRQAQRMPEEIHFRCDRCLAEQGGYPIEALINHAYLVEDPQTATGALCPACAKDDDAHHIPGSWLLTWG